MSIPKIEHILAQADRLIATSAGPTRQADLRRALSSTYYAIFHFTMVRIADQFVGSTQRASPAYALCSTEASIIGSFGAFVGRS